MANPTKTVAGKQLSPEDFAYVGDPNDPSTWKLPCHDAGHCQDALSRFSQADIPADKKTAVAKKVAAKAKAKGIDASGFEAKYTKDAGEHAESNSPWIEIFRAGDYSDKGKGKITRADLDRVIRNYDPTYHEAPVTVGHPADNLPAYGWIERLAVDGDVLLAREKQVDPKFDELRKSGRYKKRSAAFYQDGSGNITGLRHVAYLGAQPPEVKGLQDVQFEDNGREFLIWDFGEEEVVAENKSVADQIKEYFAGIFGEKAAASTFSEADVKRIATEAVNSATTALQTKIASLETSLTSQATQFSEREQKIAGAELKQRASDAVSRLKSGGKWVPAFDKSGLTLVFEELAKVTATVEFGEGDAKKPTSPLEVLVLFMESLPKIVPGGTLFNGGLRAVPGSTSSSGDPLTDAARARQKEKSISFGEALLQVADEFPELSKVGAGSAGSV